MACQLEIERRCVNHRLDTEIAQRIPIVASFDEFTDVIDTLHGELWNMLTAKRAAATQRIDSFVV